MSDAAWRDARPGETPGQLTPEGTPPQPLDLHTRLTAAIQHLLDLARAAAHGDHAEWELFEEPLGDPQYAGLYWVRAVNQGRPVTQDLNDFGVALEYTSDEGGRPVGDHIAANDPAAIIRLTEGALALKVLHAACDGRHGLALHPLACHTCSERWPCTSVTILAAMFGVEVTG